MIGKCKIKWLLFADDLVLLACFESGLQHVLNDFAIACGIARMKISTTKTEVLHLQEILSNGLCKLAEYHFSRWKSLTILGLHSQVMEGKMKN